MLSSVPKVAHLLFIPKLYVHAFMPTVWLFAVATHLAGLVAAQTVQQFEVTFDIEADDEVKLLSTSLLQTSLQMPARLPVAEELDDARRHSASLLQLSNAIVALESRLSKLSSQVDEHFAEDCVWNVEAGSYSLGFAAEDQTHYDVAGAKVACIRLGEAKCKAITCTAGGSCTLRVSPEVFTSLWAETSYIPSPGCFQASTFPYAPWSWITIPVHILSDYYRDLFVQPRRFAWKQLLAFVVCVMGTVIGAIQIKQHRFAGNMCGGFTPATMSGAMCSFIFIVISGCLCSPLVPWLLLLVTLTVAYFLPPKYISSWPNRDFMPVWWSEQSADDRR
eukprot:TRINITY_DN22590_c0_g1_i1.p1 TRINITY_DN22590_c0_g1~~TRINITY_DN22590_c0_g1_i1.p1  ORF type:complete len:334 (+),score=43.75 TRINITY_DN22590_c0_g1_i1:95-1096(+)